MRTKNPRINVTLTPSMHRLMRELSLLTGNSMSSTLADLLNGNEPVFQRMVTVLRAAKAAQKEVQEEGKASIIESLFNAQSRIEEHLGFALKAMDEGTQPLLDEKIHRRGPRPFSIADDPPDGVSGLSPTHPPKELKL